MARLRSTLFSRRGETIVEVVAACVLVLLLLGVLGGAVRFAANAQKKAEDIRAQASQAQESLRAKLAAGSYDAGKEATVSFRATNSTGTQLGVNVLFRVPVSLRAVDAGTGAGSVRFYLFSAGDLPGGTGGGG